MSDSIGLSRLAAALAGTYRIERELGAGGMATVYLAEDLKHRRRVAVKVLRPELAAVIGADRFLSEIRTTANLQHPHILPLHDSGEADGFLFYVMPYVEGETVRDRLNREKQLPIDDAVRIASEVAGALDYAHRHGVIHRDIKPENILLHDGSALVADFGIALAASTAGQDRMTETGMSLGTPHYMSPEQAMGEREITARSDVYALGCVLYEMLLGEPPFTGPTVQSIVAKVMSEKPAPLTARRDRIPLQVEDATLTALEKLPADRFVSAAAFAHALTDPSAVTSSYAARRASAPAGGRSPMVRGVILTVAVVVIGLIAFGLGRRGGTPDAGARPTSLAVLPFENIGGNPENEYFSDGVTEDIIAQVSQIAGLRVISRTSTAKFKGGNTSIRDIGQQLGVTSVLEGSVRRQGNRIRIVAQLIDARTDEHLWASTYDRELEDIFAIQTDVANNIASALGSMLTTGGGAVSVPTTNLEAYELYLNGRLLIAQRTSDALHTAVERFEAALALDPKFAAAYGGLAEAWMLLPVYSAEPATDAFAKVERYADSALALDPKLSVAYAARAFDRAFIGWQFADGERDLKKAIRLNPNFSSAHQWLGSVLMVQGKVDEALSSFQQAVKLDPLSSINATDLAMNFFAFGRFSEAEAQFQQVMTRDPQFAPAFQRAGWLYGTQGNDSAAAEVLEQWNLLQGRPLVAPGTIRTAYAAGGRDSMYALLVAPGVRDRAPIFDLASWYVYLGNDAEALEVLEEAARRRDPFLGAGLRFPMWAPLKDEPRYEALLKRVYGDD